MKKEFNLSRTIIGDDIQIKYVKEFIKRLKEELRILLENATYHEGNETLRIINEDINKLAGSELTKENKEDEN